MASTMFFTTIGQGQTVEAFVTFGRQNVKLNFLNQFKGLYIPLNVQTRSSKKTRNKSMCTYTNKNT